MQGICGAAAHHGDETVRRDEGGREVRQSVLDPHDDYGVGPGQVIARGRQEASYFAGGR